MQNRLNFPEVIGVLLEYKKKTYTQNQLISNRLPSVADGFIGRKTDAKDCNKKLAKSGILFIGGVAGIGKSEFAKYYANTNKDKYTNIIYIHYSGDLKKRYNRYGI